MAARPERGLRNIRRVIAAGAVLLLALSFAIFRLVPGPIPPVPAYSLEVLDRYGERLRLYLSADGYWRFPATLGGIDPRFLDMLLAYEDRRFRQHAGVDFLALGRALGQALRHGRFVSGGSTLTMQTVRLLEPRPRTLAVKLLEMLGAWQLERRLDKDAILRLYLELAPYGGNLQGVRAASLFYFGKEPGLLSTAEAALLVALPQSPERRRPDLNPLEAREARDSVLRRMARAGLLSPEEASRAMADPVPTVRRPPPFLAPHLADRLRPRRDDDARVRTTLDAGLQLRIGALLDRHRRGREPGVTLAALVVDNVGVGATAYVGSSDFFADTFPGEVDMIRAVRSPGSTLKPFIYGLGFEAGLIHPETLIADRPGPVRGYSPGNFDGRYKGELSVREALTSSRNLPAVRVLDRLGPARFVDRLERAGVRLRLPGSTASPGLPIALGGVGVSLQDLVVLYAGLANGGRVGRLRLLQNEPETETMGLITPEAAWYLTDILADSPVPDGFLRSGGRAAFKTGTSYGFRDAWALGFDAEHTVGVWVGRPDGGYTAGLSGLRDASPVLLEIFDLLSGPGLSTLLRRQPPDLMHAENRELPMHLRRFDRAIAEVPPSATPEKGPRVVFPPDESLVHVETMGDADVLVESRGGTPPFHWLVDGRYTASTPTAGRLSWRPRQWGKVSVTVVDGRGRSDRVRFEVASLPR